MRCPSCGDLRDRVVDSRQTEDGRSIRRRRECETCGGRFTTFERVETALVQVRKRDGEVEGFDASKVAAGVSAACKSRPVDPGQIAVLVADVEDALRSMGKEVTSDEVGLEVLLRLRALDEVAAVRFASVYKGFDTISDFEREIRLLQEPS
ncbi:transcriptional regulator NrdR [Acidimicrobiia bacterium EGI L10123]|uniref:transcriptional regulator NrdR n=1 Tax=Salinilacustrithrix flava TaxID=2957203 RepID=UPI003D7C1CEF|nr:transcriptional regulator NrdR [Acidimicrobiia bacterium EGI L10123]